MKQSLAPEPIIRATSEFSFEDRESLWAEWRWWIFPTVLGVILVFVFVDPFVGDWDALDYTVLAVRGSPSSMFLGRTLFIFANHGLWLMAHTFLDLPVDKAYLLFKYAVILQSPLAVVAWWSVARDLTNSSRAATLACLIIALSPFYIIYSGQAMTEIPWLLLLAIAIKIHLTGLRTGRVILVFIGAALLGLGANIRESALLFAPWLLLGPWSLGWRLKKRPLAITGLACFVFAICALGPFLFMFCSNIANFRSDWHVWVEVSRLEEHRHPVSIGNLKVLLHYFFIGAPIVLVTLPFAIHSELRERGFSPALALSIVGLLANLSLIVHYSASINWRYMLTGIPAMSPLAAAYIVRLQTQNLRISKHGFTGVVLMVALISLVAGRELWPMDAAYLAERSLAKNYLARIALVPRDAVMISGSQTVAVTYWRGLGAGDWGVIGSGSRWPAENLASVISQKLTEGRRVFIDADPRWWRSDGWQSEETRELVQIEELFNFRQVSETIYEIRSPHDANATDLPRLTRLLAPNDHRNSGVVH